MPHNPVTELEVEFLKQSNLIEREPAEGVALADAISAWRHIKKLDAITTLNILRCHKLMMRSRRSIPERSKGRWTTVQTGIYANGRLVRENPPPIQVPGMMDAFVTGI